MDVQIKEIHQKELADLFGMRAASSCFAKNDTEVYDN